MSAVLSRATRGRRRSVVARTPERLLSTTNLRSLVQVVDVKLLEAVLFFTTDPY